MKGLTLNKKIVATAACAFLALALTGCGSKAEEPNLPDPNASSSSSGYTITDAAKLKALSVGESAVWRDYEVTVKSIDRTNGQLNVQIDVKAHANAQQLSTECLLSFGMPPVSSTFANNTISVPAGETASGTLTFDDRYSSQRLFWNDGATEATWLLDQTPATAEPEPQPEAPAEPATPEPAEDPQAKAVAAVEAALPGLIADNTYYTYQSFDPTTASVTPTEGGYQYANDVSILDGEGNATVTNVLLVCDADGNVTSMTIDGALLF